MGFLSHKNDNNSLSHNFNDASTDQTDPPRYVIKDETPPNWTQIKASVKNKSAKKQRDVKAKAKAPFAYMKILRTALKDNDAKTWNKTIQDLREKHPDDILVFDRDMTLANKEIEGFDFTNIEFRNIRFAKNLFVSCNFNGASFDVSDLASGKVRDGIFNNCTFTECAMDIQPFRENVLRTCDKGRTFLTATEIDFPPSEDDTYVQTTPLFDGVNLNNVDEFDNGRRTEVPNVYKGGCEFIDCKLPSAMEKELALKDDKGRQAYMVHLSKTGISMAEPNPKLDGIKNNTDSLTDYYAPMAKRVERKNGKLKEEKRSCPAGLRRTKATNHLGGKQH